MKIKGHTSIILTDVKTGKVERHEDDNLITNAITKYFQNCGLLNYPNVNQNNMVEELLGGVLAFDDEITESASRIYAPPGVKMIANGSVGTVNNSEVLELGSYSTTESGWQNDGSYVQTYDYTTAQANGTIACVCLTGKNYGYAGEGNTISGVRHSSPVNVTNLGGSVTSYSGMAGMAFKVDITDSSCYTFNIEEREVEEETIIVGCVRKYRIPLIKINIKGKQNAPVLMSETDVTLPQALVDAYNDLSYASRALYPYGNLLFQPHDGKMRIWDFPRTSSSSNQKIWGDDFTQHLWTVTTAGTITSQTVTNTTGETLSCLGPAIFDGNYCFFPWNGLINSGGGNYMYISTNKVFVWNLTTGTMNTINNPYYWDARCGTTIQPQWIRKVDCGWSLLRGSGEGRIITMRGGYGSGQYAPSVVYDASNLTSAPTNISTISSDSVGERVGGTYTASDLIRFPCELGNGLRLYRDQTYIASINNLDTPVVKTAEKTMKIIYRLTFEEEES